MGARLISAADLEFAGFTPTAGNWAGKRGIEQSAVKVVGPTATCLNDPSKFYLMDGSANQEIIIPTNLTQFKVQNILTIIRIGTGDVTITPANGVTLLGESEEFVLTTQYTLAQFIKIAENQFVVMGKV